MLSKQPLKQVLIEARSLWDHPGVREAARKNFNKVVPAELLHSALKSFRLRERIPIMMSEIVTV